MPQKIKDGAYVINLDEYGDVGTHWITLCCNRNEIVYFDCFGVERDPEEIKEFVSNKNIKANIFRVHTNDLGMCEYFCIGFNDFMLAGKKFTDYTSLFSPHDFRKTMILFCHIFMMNKSNSIEAIDRTDLSEQTKFRLDEVSKIENYFHDEINQRKSCNKKLSKYVAVFDYIDKILIVLSATTWSVGAPVGIASASFPLIFSLTTGIVKNVLSLTRKKNMIKILSWLKANSIALEL